METWGDVFTSTPTKATEDVQHTPSEQEEEYVPEDILIVLLFDSTLSANRMPPWGRSQNTEENYNFTVRQHKLAKETKLFIP
jgi:hypothetical protein